jgi:hypothetical protein
MISITKDVLRQLNAAVGKLDTDSGEIFAGFVGRRERNDGLYHGELRYSPPGDDPPKETCSIKAITAPPKTAKPSKPAKPAKSAKPDELTEPAKPAKSAKPDELTDMEN